MDGSTQMLRNLARLAVLFTTAVGASFASADDVFWDGSPSSNWGNANNWHDSTTNGAKVPDVSDVAIFSSSGTTNGIVNLNGDQSVKRLDFKTGLAITINSGTGDNKLHINTSGIIVETNAASETINSRVELTATQNWAINSNHTLTLNNETILAENNNTFALSVASTGNVVFNGVVDQVSGSGSLTMNGSGTLTLSNNNTYNGGTTVNSGIVALGTSSSLGTGPVAFNGGIIRTLGSIAPGNNMGFEGAGGTFDTGAFSPTFSGSITGAGGLTKIGAGTMILAGSGSWTGGTTVSQGYLQGDTNSLKRSINVAAGAGVIFNQGADGTFNTGGAGMITGAGSLTKIGAGTLTLQDSGSYTNYSYSGGTYLNQGWISIDHDSELGNPLGGLVFNGGGLRFTAGISSSRAVALNSPGGVIDTNGTDSIFSGVFSGAGALTKAGNGTLRLSGNNTYIGGTIVNAGTLQVGDAGSSGSLGSGDTTVNYGLVFNRSDTAYAYNGVISGSGFVTMIGTGIIQLGGANTYTGGTTINAGAIRITSDANLGATSGTLTFNGGQLHTLAPITSARSVALSSSGGTIDTDGYDSTFTGKFTGTGSLTKNGPGKLSLSGGTNDYSGNTKVTGGTLLLSNSLALQNSTLDYNSYGGSIQFGPQSAYTLGGLQGNQSLSLTGGAGNVALSIGNNNGDTLYSGTLSGGGSLTKIGIGKASLAGANTYSGGTTINAGTLRISTDSNLGAASGGLTFDGGTLQTLAGITSARAIQVGLNGGSIDTNGFDSTFGGGISGAGANSIGTLAKVGSGTLHLSGSTPTSGFTLRLDVNSGELAHDVGSTTGYINNNSTFLQFGGTVGSPTSQIDNEKLFIQDGGTVTGPLINHGTYIYFGGTFNAQLLAGSNPIIRAEAGTVPTVIVHPPSFDGNTVFPLPAPMNSKWTIYQLTSTSGSGPPTSVAVGATATITGSATVQLDGTISPFALGSNRVNVVVNSNASPGLLVTGQNQAVGSISGTGNVQVTSGGDLTATSIQASSLTIGDTSGNPGRVTIGASDAAGNPLTDGSESSGLLLASSLAPSGPFSLDVERAVLFDDSSAGVPIGGSSMPGALIASGSSSVPEPATLSLTIAAFGGALAALRLRRSFGSARPGG